MPSSSPVMWLRRDLRVRDNPALLAALADGPVTGLFVIDPVLWPGVGAAPRGGGGPRGKTQPHPQNHPPPPLPFPPSA